MIKNKLKQVGEYKPTTDIVLTYGGDKNTHGICGHLFELIDYYIFLKQYTSYSVSILIREYIHQNDIDLALTKYKKNFIKNINFEIQNPKIINNKNSIIIITDGNIGNTVFNCKRIILFPCGIRDYKPLIKPNIANKVLFLTDLRLSYNLPENIEKIDYRKKINFFALLPISSFSYKANKNLTLYSTSNCKLIGMESLKRIKETYSDYNIMILLNEKSPLDKKELQLLGFEVRYVPIHKLFEKIGTYLYTSTSRKWDCSPRMIAECKHYKIPIIYDEDITEEYLNIDLGLKYRIQDIENDFYSIDLNESDELLVILDNILITKEDS